MATWSQDTVQFLQAQVPVRHISQSKRNRSCLNAMIGQGQGQSIALAEIDRGPTLMLNLFFHRLIKHRLAKIHPDDLGASRQAVT
jgi:hypothetical protein